ncbi:hypothetical protein PRZ48_007885 [Zasmidium cellare]|uniref:chitin deacetylase n=1 Tax=Zasmidium cellare TaxID=395010 RepID=A0ABR0EKI2_ZASCE|nr:hypothetical protein PRZ48_007885 [Zasmidium cellare]
MSPDQPEAERLRRLHEAGHQLGSHACELNKLLSASGLDDCNTACRREMKAMGYKIVLWNIDPVDWKSEIDVNTTLKILEEQDASAHAEGSGAIVLMHDRILQTAEVLLPEVLGFFEARGYDFVTIGDCLGAD